MKLIQKTNYIFVDNLIKDIFKMNILNFEFIRNNNSEERIQENFNLNLDILKKYYPKYFYSKLYNCNFNNIITIINHFLKDHNLKFKKIETTNNKKKLYKYYIKNQINNNDEEIKKLIIDNNKKITVNFN